MPLPKAHAEVDDCLLLTHHFILLALVFQAPITPRTLCSAFYSVQASSSFI